ncbi:MAG: hypothetical protein AAFO69_10035, partial [Bacteroidota bacterium]
MNTKPATVCRQIPHLIATLLLFLLPFVSDYAIAQDVDSTKVDQWVSQRNKLLRDRKYQESLVITNKLYEYLTSAEKHKEAIHELSIGSEAYWQRGMVSETDSMLDFVREKAVFHLDEPEKLYTSLFGNVASSYLISGQLDSAISNYKKALYYFELNEETNGLISSSIIYNLGVSFFYAGELDSTVHYFEQAHRINKAYYIEIERDTVDFTMLSYHTSLATLYEQLSQYRKAIQEFEQALEMQKVVKTKDPLLYINYGLTLTRIGAFEHGIDNVNIGLNILREEGNLWNSSVITSYLGLVEYYCTTGELHQADSLMDLYTVKYPDEQKTDYVVSYEAFTRGYIEFHRQQYRKAVQYFEEANEQLKLIPSRKALQISLNDNLSRSLVQLGEHKEAFAILEQNKSLIEDVYGRKSRQWYSNIEPLVGYYIEEGNREKAIALLKEMQGAEVDSVGNPTESYIDPWSQISIENSLAALYLQNNETKELQTAFKYYHNVDSVISNLRFAFLDFQDRLRLSDSINYIYDNVVGWASELSDQNPEFLEE